MTNNRKDQKGRILKEGESVRKDGRYQYRYKNINNQWKYVYAGTLEELRQKKEKVILGKLSGYDTSHKYTISDICKKWLALEQGLVKETTYANYYKCSEIYINPDIGFRKISDCTSAYILEYFKSLKDDKQLLKGTLKRIFLVLNFSFKLAQQEGWVAKNVVEGLNRQINRLGESFEVVPENPLMSNRLTPAQADAFLSYLDTTNRRQYERFFFLLYTGLRVSEFCGLLWEDIDFHNNCIYVRHNLVYYKPFKGKSKSVMLTPKTKASIRVVPMLPKVKDLLICKKVQEERSTDFDEYKGFVFSSIQKTPMKCQVMAENLKYSIKKYNALQDNNKLKIQHCTPHTLRHTFCSMLYENHVDIKVIQSIMGHTTSATTLDWYTDITPEMTETELNKLPNFTNSEYFLNLNF